MSRDDKVCARYFPYLFELAPIQHSNSPILYIRMSFCWSPSHSSTCVLAPAVPFSLHMVFQYKLNSHLIYATCVAAQRHSFIQYSTGWCEHIAPCMESNSHNSTDTCSRGGKGNPDVSSLSMLVPPSIEWILPACILQLFSPSSLVFELSLPLSLVIEFTARRLYTCHDGIEFRCLVQTILSSSHLIKLEHVLGMSELWPAQSWV